MTIDEFIRGDTFSRYADSAAFYREVKMLWNRLRCGNVGKDVIDRVLYVLAVMLDWMDAEDAEEDDGK